MRVALAKWRVGVGFFVENPKGDFSKFVIFKKSPRAGGSITLALIFLCTFLVPMIEVQGDCIKTKGASPKANV